MCRRLSILLLGIGWLCASGGGPNLVRAEQSSPSIALEPIVSDGLDHPVYATHAGDGSGRLFVVEQPGRIRIVTQGSLLANPFLDISDHVRYGGEQGLLGLAFHPEYKRNGRFFVNYVRRSDGHTVIAEFRTSSNAEVALIDERPLLTVAQPYPNHKGGMVEFGPDGFLYIALGDGGSGGDPGNRGQNRNELLGKLLRIDVDHGTPESTLASGRSPLGEAEGSHGPGGTPYTIPSDNPFASGGGRPEIFAYGLRNPWRFSFDRQTGDLWAADVGQNAWEEIDIVKRGGNYGWRIMEGFHCYLPREGCSRDGLIPPVAEYAHDKGRCSITGGYVYRGSRLPALRGSYLYGDFCSGEIFVFADGTQQTLLTTSVRIASFGQDQEGELYVVGHGGTIHRIVEARR